MINEKETGFASTAAAFERAFCDTISTSAGIQLQRQNGEIDGEFSLMGVMPFFGEQSGILIIKANHNHMQRLTSYMTGAEPEEITKDDMNDCIAELANMTCGQAKLLASTSSVRFTLTIPFCITSSAELDCIFRKGTNVTTQNYIGDEIILQLQVILRQL